MFIKDITKDLNIRVEVPYGQNLKKLDAMVNEENSDNNGESQGSRGNILLNLKPLYHMNMVHFALFTYLKAFTEKGFSCTIVLQDLITGQGNFVPQISTIREAQVAMDVLYERLVKFGINMTRIEVLPESGLIRLYNRGERKFLNDLIKLSAIADNEGLGNVSTKSFDHIDSLCNFLYELYIQPHYVITGGNELNTVWYKLRRKGSLVDMVIDSYNPPVMLVLPDLKKHNANELLSTLDTNDPFSEDFIFKSETSLSQEYIRQIQILNYSSRIVGSENPLEIINGFSKKMYD